MKLKAPPGVGDPCVAGATVASRDGLYEVEGEIGALLIECFGFVEAADEISRATSASASAPAPAAPAPAAMRRPAPAQLPKLRHPAWRDQPAAKKP
jgi:hypothetical protein